MKLRVINLVNKELTRLEPEDAVEQLDCLIEKLKMMLELAKQDLPEDSDYC